MTQNAFRCGTGEAVARKAVTKSGDFNCKVVLGNLSVLTPNIQYLDFTMKAVLTNFETVILYYK
jgi:hypothetical protein